MEVIEYLKNHVRTDVAPSPIQGVGDDLRVRLRDPAVEARDAHGARATRGAKCGGARAVMRRRWRFDRIKYDLIYMF